MERFEYTRMKLEMIPDNIIQQYNLTQMEENGWVYIDVQKGMYGLPRVGISGNTQATKYLINNEYELIPLTPGL